METLIAGVIFYAIVHFLYENRFHLEFGKHKGEDIILAIVVFLPIVVVSLFSLVIYIYLTNLTIVEAVKIRSIN